MRKFKFFVSPLVKRYPGHLFWKALSITCSVIVFTGNLAADALVDFHINFEHANSSWGPASIAVLNGGSVRASVPKGKLTIRVI